MTTESAQAATVLWDPMPRDLSADLACYAWTASNPAPEIVAYAWTWRQARDGATPSIRDLAVYSGRGKTWAQRVRQRVLDDIDSWGSGGRLAVPNGTATGQSRDTDGTGDAQPVAVVDAERDTRGTPAGQSRDTSRARSSLERKEKGTSTPQGGPAGPAAPDAPKPAGPDIGQPPLEPWLHGQGKGATRPPADWLAREGGGDRELGRLRLRDAVAEVTKAVTGHADPSRIVAPGKALTSLLAFLEWPPLATWLPDALLVADAMHHCPDKVFARNIRAEGWADGVNRSRSVGTLAVHERWGDRLEAAQRWKRVAGSQDPPPGPAQPRRGPPVKVDPAALLFGQMLVEFEAETMRPGGIERLTTACRLAAEGGGPMEDQMARVRARLAPTIQLQCLQGGAS